MNRTYTYKCQDCGAFVTLVRKADCPLCGGKVRCTPEPKQTKICVVCAKRFIPATKTVKCCSKTCIVELRRSNNAASSKARYGKPKQDTAERTYYSRPWAWIEMVYTDHGNSSGKRKILHTLEEQSSEGNWPWPDVFEGTVPCICEQAPFL